MRAAREHSPISRKKERPRQSQEARLVKPRAECSVGVRPGSVSTSTVAPALALWHAGELGMAQGLSPRSLPRSRQSFQTVAATLTLEFRTRFMGNVPLMTGPIPFPPLLSLPDVEIGALVVGKFDT